LERELAVIALTRNLGVIMKAGENGTFLLNMCIQTKASINHLLCDRSSQVISKEMMIRRQIYYNVWEIASREKS